MNSRLIYLDISRFFAIIGVIAVHVSQAARHHSVISPIAEFGRFGVQLFFVISGATVFLTYEHYRQKKNYLLIFYIKRFFRIVPLFILMAAYYSYRFNNNFISSILPWSGFDPFAYNNIEGGWSIWNEMYFYLIFPFYYVLRKKNKIIFIAIIFSIVSILINLRLFSTADFNILKDYDYLNFFTQFICFVIGIEHFGRKKSNIIIFFLTYFVSGVVSKLIFYPEYFYSADYGSLYWTAPIAVTALFFVQLVQYITPRLNGNLSYFKKGFSYLGQKTYTSYMIHFIIIDITGNFLEHLSFVVSFLIVVIITFLLTIYIERFTEKYWVQLGKKKKKKMELK